MLFMNNKKLDNIQLFTDPLFLLTLLYLSSCSYGTTYPFVEEYHKLFSFNKIAYLN